MKTAHFWPIFVFNVFKGMQGTSTFCANLKSQTSFKSYEYVAIVKSIDQIIAPPPWQDDYGNYNRPQNLCCHSTLSLNQTIVCCTSV